MQTKICLDQKANKPFDLLCAVSHTYSHAIIHKQNFLTYVGKDYAWQSFLPSISKDFGTSGG